MNKIIVGNWKMNPKSIKEAEAVFKETTKIIKGLKSINVIICPPSPFLFIGSKIKIKSFNLGAQNCFYEPNGTHTGRVSVKMLESLGVEYLILGHSESRALGETNKIINKKVLLALKEKITPIVCIGENNRDKNGFYLATIKHQLTECLSSVPKSRIKDVIVAYEPIWAIGENAIHEATGDEFVEIQIFIKKIISDLYGLKTTNDLRIIYGGSVHPKNASEFIEKGADGLLIGRDSLKPKKFKGIIDSIA